MYLLLHIVNNSRCKNYKMIKYVYLDKTCELCLWNTSLSLVHKIQNALHLPTINILKLNI